ncbi:TRIC cation channel family protein, partial [Escherichia coli]|nr:TRIC cation channel family protein [Escherichia coli]
LAYNASGMVAVIMGVITGCGGGIIRDVLAREVPMVLRSEVYATACIIGGIFHTMAVSMGYDHSTALLAGVISTLVIRLGAIR